MPLKHLNCRNCALILCLLVAFSCHAQDTQSPAPQSPTPQSPQEPKEQPTPVLAPAKGDPANNIDASPDKRAFGVLPNYRTAEGTQPFQPLTVKQKFTIATKDSFDGPVFLTTAAFALLSQWQGTDNPVYGQGVKGFGYRYGISYADQVIGNYFPEAIVPSIFHTDPRYFRKGEGSFSSRLLYSFSRMFVCKNNNGNLTFNVNEFVGNSSAALLSSSYHPHERTVGDMASQAGSFMISDAIGQIAKEFWPDVKKRLSKHHD